MGISQTKFMRSFKFLKFREMALLAFCYALALLPPFLAELWMNYSGVHYL